MTWNESWNDVAMSYDVIAERMAISWSKGDVRVIGDAVGRRHDACGHGAEHMVIVTSCICQGCGARAYVMGPGCGQSQGVSRGGAEGARPEAGSRAKAKGGARVDAKGGARVVV